MDEKRRKLISAALTMAVWSSGHATERHPIYLVATGNNPYQQSLIFAVKEALGGSKTLDLAPSVKGSYMTIYFQVLDVPPTGSLVYTAVFTVDEVYQNSILGTCNLSIVKSCAESIIASADGALEDYRRTLPRPSLTK